MPHGMTMWLPYGSVCGRHMESGEREDKSEMKIFFQNILEIKKEKKYRKVRGSFLSLG